MNPRLRSALPLTIQVLAKIARSAERDLADVELLLRAGVATWRAVEAAWAEVRARDTGWLRQPPPR